MLAKNSQKEWELIHTAGKRHKVCIYDVQSKSSLLKIYIDRTPPVDLKTCEQFMKTLLFLLESEGLNNRECEVSTPGLERFLRQDWHFKSAVGQTIKVITSQPFSLGDSKASVNQKGGRVSLKQGRGRFSRVVTGQLYKYQDQVLFLDTKLFKPVIPVRIVTKAHIVFEGQQKKVKEKKL